MTTSIIGRQRELDLVQAALAAGAHILLEGPPGTGKSTLLRQVAQARHTSFVLVEGNAELTPTRLIGAFDPALVLQRGYLPDIFVDGPLVDALREGSLLYVEEINRIPEETINVLLTVMSEGEINVPRLGRVVAAPDFRLVAAMNPYDAVGTSRLSSALYDRSCRIAVGYQDAQVERQIVASAAPGGDPDLAALAVEVVRGTRDHPDVRTGSSVRGAIDLARMVPQLATIRDAPPDDLDVGLDSATTALSGRIRLHESAHRSADEVIREIYLAARRVRGADPDEDRGGGDPGEPEAARRDRRAAIPAVGTTPSRDGRTAAR